MSTTKQNTGERFYADTEGSRLHGLFAALFYIFAVLLAIALLAIFANSLDDFLHAPIGIKDDPPEPGLIVQFAQLAWLPLLLSTLLLGVWSFLTTIFKFIPLLLGTLIVTTGLVSLAGGALIMYQGKEHGFFALTVTPIAWATFIVSWIGVFAYQCFEKWKSQRKANFLIAGVCFTIAVCCGTSLFVFGALSRSNASATAMAIALCTGGAAFLIGLAAYKF